MKTPKLLDLFCGAGGASMGYSRAGFEVVGVDIKPQPHYPFPMIELDAICAMECLLDGKLLRFKKDGHIYILSLNDFDAYHASPPCQAYVDNNLGKETTHPKLIEPTRERFELSGKPFVIENVVGAPFLKASLMLCGTMFGLRVIRHRYFEFNVPGPFSPFSCNHWGTVINADFAPVYGRGSKGRRYIEVDEDGQRVRKRIGRGNPPPHGWSFKQWFMHSMDIDWVQTTKELTEAIPPAYTEYIGKYLIEAIRQNHDGI